MGVQEAKHLFGRRNEMVFMVHQSWTRVVESVVSIYFMFFSHPSRSSPIDTRSKI